MRDLFDFSAQGAFRPEDRWLRFALRLSFVLFAIGLEAVVIASAIKLLHSH